MLIGLQLVGLNVNPGRSRLTLMSRSCSGMPCRICGNGSVEVVTEPSSWIWMPPLTTT